MKYLVKTTMKGIPRSEHLKTLGSLVDILCLYVVTLYYIHLIKSTTKIKFFK